MDYIHTISTIDNLRSAFKRVQKSSGWKYQTQYNEINLLPVLVKLQKEIRDGTYRPAQGTEFILHESGRTRLVKALTVRDAIVQHSICDNVLVPNLSQYLIHDNGASLKCKGIGFTRRRFDEMLHRYYGKHGKEGYILKMDFRKYFDNIQHEKLLALIAEKIPDKELLRLLEIILRQFEVDVSYSEDENIIDGIFNSLAYGEIDKSLLTGERFMRKSMGIGSPISQIAGIFYPTRIDNYCKTVKGCKYYSAYMDDRVILHESKDFLAGLLNEVREVAAGLGVHIHPNKTQIIRIKRGFTFLKTKYYLTDTGRIVHLIPHDVVVRERRKLKKLTQLVKAGNLSVDDFMSQYRGWRGDKKWYDACQTVSRMDLLYKELLKEVKGNGRDDECEALCAV